MNNSIENFFNQHVEIFDANRDLTTIISLLDKCEIKEHQKVLDLACGTGVISNELQKRSKDIVVAIDISSKMIERAIEKNKNPNIIFLNRDFYTFDEGSFDQIIVYNAYPHFIDVEKFVEKAQKKLNKNGHLAILHDLSLKELNVCHNGHDSSLSRKIVSLDEEIRHFNKHFNVLLSGETDNSFYMIFERK